MVEREGEAFSNEDLEGLVERVEERIAREIEKKLGRRSQYVVVISLRRASGGAIDLGIDLQIFSHTGGRGRLGEIAEEVIESGIDEAERHIKRSWKRAGRDLEEEKDSYSFTSVG
jgi:hypothetical protein